MNILKINESWIAPYLLQLVGEYVVGILYGIYENLNSQNINFLKQIINLNPIFYSKIKQLNIRKIMWE